MNRYNIAKNNSIMLHGFRVPEGALYGSYNGTIYICTNYRTKNGYYTVYVLDDTKHMVVSKTLHREIHVQQPGYAYYDVFEHGAYVGTQPVVDNPSAGAIEYRGRSRRSTELMVYDRDIWRTARVHKLSELGKGITHILEKFKPVVVANYKQNTRANTRVQFVDKRPQTKGICTDRSNTGKVFTSKSKSANGSIWREEPKKHKTVKVG